MRQNTNKTIFPSQGYTASQNSGDFINDDHRGAYIIINVTAKGAAPSVTFKVQGKDPVSGAYFDLLTSVAITAVGTTALLVYPGVLAAANVALGSPLPQTFRVVATAGNSDSLTYTVVAQMIR